MSDAELDLTERLALQQHESDERFELASGQPLQAQAPIVPPPNCPWSFELKHHTLPSATSPEEYGLFLIRRFGRDRPATSQYAPWQCPALLSLASASLFCCPRCCTQQTAATGLQATKLALSVPCGNQKHIVSCPVFIAFCADLTRIESVLNARGHDIEDNNLELGLVSTIDAALVGMAAYVAADSLGIQGVMIGAVRNDPERIAELLGLPERVYCVFGMCLGYPDEAPKQKPRMAAEGISLEQIVQKTPHRPDHLPPLEERLPEEPLAGHGSVLLELLAQDGATS